VWKRFVDDFNFKGYGVSIYKSFLHWKAAGIAFRIPLINNWDWWDSNPVLPSLNFLFCIYYPLNVSVCLTSSINVDVVKCWLVQTLLLVQACMLRFIHHMLSALWTIMSVILYPVVQKWHPVPFHYDQSSQQIMRKRKEIQPSYKSDVQERLGISYWYRWRPDIGFSTRVSAWHLYMPTLELYSHLLTGSKDNLGQWWRSHFASLGLDTAIPNPDPPHVFLTSVLSFSGLRFKSSSRSTASSLKQKLDAPGTEQITMLTTTTTIGEDDDHSTSSSDNVVNSDRARTKAKLSSILNQEGLDEHDLLSKVGRGGNTTAASYSDEGMKADQSNPVP
jgi:hypothetical protein